MKCLMRQLRLTLAQRLLRHCPLADFGRQHRVRRSEVRPTLLELHALAGKRGDQPGERQVQPPDLDRRRRVVIQPTDSLQRPNRPHGGAKPPHE